MIPDWFSKVVIPIYTPSSSVFSVPVIPSDLILSSLTGMKLHLSVILICVSQIITGIKHLLYVPWLFMFPVLWNTVHIFCPFLFIISYWFEGIFKNVFWVVTIFIDVDTSHSVADMLFWFVACLHYLCGVFLINKFLFLMYYIYELFTSLLRLFFVLFKKSFPTPRSEGYFPMLYLSFCI